MKKIFLLLLLASVGLFTSCQKDKDVAPSTTQGEETFEFQKKMVLTDTEGNRATIQVGAHTQSALDAHTKDVLSLKVMTRDFSQMSSNVSSDPVNVDETKEEKFDTDINNNVLIKTLDFQFNKNVTGFSFESSLDANHSGVEPRYSNTEYHYLYDATNFHVVGAVVWYLSESRSKEYMKVKLSKKTSSSNWFWQQLQKSKLYSPGNTFYYQGTTEWEEYRLKIKTLKKRGNGHSHDWAWVI